MIERLFDETRDPAFTSEELCEAVYPGLNRIEAKHRFAVTRAIRAIAERRRDFAVVAAKTQGNPLVVFNRLCLGSLRKTAPFIRLAKTELNDDGPWAPAIALANAQAIGDEVSQRRAIGEMRNRPDAYVYGFEYALLDALLGDDAYDRLLRSKTIATVIGPDIF